jgi:hypothetical protein
MSTHHYKTWGEASGLPESAARLDRLPPDLTLSDDFPEPIRYDPGAKRLVYRGFMCSSSYAYLRTCCKDLHYLNALDSLFQQTAASLGAKRKQVKKRPWRWLLAVAAAGAAAIAAWIMMHRH